MIFMTDGITFIGPIDAYREPFALSCAEKHLRTISQDVYVVCADDLESAKRKFPRTRVVPRSN